LLAGLKKLLYEPHMLIDSHCHLDFPDFDAERDALIARARDSGVEYMLTISTRVKKAAIYQALAEKYANVFYTIGTHPHQAHEELDVTVEELIALSQHPKCVGIGEAGLDYHYDYSPRAAQRQGLLNHIAAARQTGLPLIIHSRQCDADMAEILTSEMKQGEFKAVLHCFTAGEILAKTALDLGLYISFSGVVTYKNAPELREIANWVPRERILVETDSPYLAPGKMRGKRNEPSFVVETAKVVAATRGEDYAAFAQQTSENFFRLFDKAKR
jgi:TatD DNase family protein